MKSALVKRIMQIVAKRYDITINEIMAVRRTNSHVRARHIAITVAIRTTPLSLPQIGRCFNRDHTTIIHARDKIEQEALGNPSLARELDEIASSAIGEEMEFVRNNLKEIATHLAPLIIGQIKDQIKSELQASLPKAPAKPLNPALVAQNKTSKKPSLKLPDVNEEIHAAISTVLIAHRQLQTELYGRQEPFARQNLDKAVGILGKLHAELFTKQEKTS